jgi:hypothetical protein
LALHLLDQEASPIVDSNQSYKAPMNLPGKVVAEGCENIKPDILASVNYIIPHGLEECNVLCKACQALHWLEEAAQVDMDNEEIAFTLCCQKNKVSLPSVHPSAPQFPSVLKGLYSGKDEGMLCLCFAATILLTLRRF